MSTVDRLDDATAVHTARCGGCKEVTTAVIETLAAAEGIEPTDLDVCIADVVEPDALNSLFDSVIDRSGYVTFPLADHLVCVSATGEIELYRRSYTSKEAIPRTIQTALTQRVRVTEKPRTFRTLATMLKSARTKKPSDSSKTVIASPLRGAPTASGRSRSLKLASSTLLYIP